MTPWPNLRQALTRPASGPLDPRTVPEIMAGGLWVPGQSYVATGGGNHTWDSLATNKGTGYKFTDAWDGNKPSLGTASNGAPIWNYTNGTSGAWVIYPDPIGSALRFSGASGDEGSIFGWFRADVDDTALRYLVEMWPGGSAPGQQRFFAYHNNTAGKMSMNGAAVGLGDADPTDRWKANVIGIDFTDWNFFEWEFDYTQPNYSVAGAYFSHRMRFSINGTLITETGAIRHEGYSAPPAPYNLPPDGPVFGPGLYTGDTRLCLGGNFTGSPWKGSIGWFGIARGKLSAAKRRRIMVWNAPA